MVILLENKRPFILVAFERCALLIGSIAFATNCISTTYKNNVLLHIQINKFPKREKKSFFLIINRQAVVTNPRK